MSQNGFPITLLKGASVSLYNHSHSHSAIDLCPGSDVRRGITCTSCCIPYCVHGAQGVHVV